MFKRLFTLCLALALLHIGNTFDLARASQTDASPQKIKAFVGKRGTGPKARVALKLKDRSKMKGYISEIASDSFTVADSKTGQPRTLAYSDVMEIKKPGGLSLAAKIGIGAGAVLGALALTWAIACHDDPFC
jgi:hypothetical protein